MRAIVAPCLMAALLPCALACEPVEPSGFSGGGLRVPLTVSLGDVGGRATVSLDGDGEEVRCADVYVFRKDEGGILDAHVRVGELSESSSVGSASLLVTPGERQVVAVANGRDTAMSQPAVMTDLSGTFSAEGIDQLRRLPLVGSSSVVVGRGAAVAALGLSRLSAKVQVEAIRLAPDSRVPSGTVLEAVYLMNVVNVGSFALTADGEVEVTCGGSAASSLSASSKGFVDVSSVPAARSSAASGGEATYLNRFIPDGDSGGIAVLSEAESVYASCGEELSEDKDIGPFHFYPLANSAAWGGTGTVDYVPDDAERASVTCLVLRLRQADGTVGYLHVPMPDIRTGYRYAFSELLLTSAGGQDEWSSAIAVDAAVSSCDWTEGSVSPSF